MRGDPYRVRHIMDREFRHIDLLVVGAEKMRVEGSHIYHRSPMMSNNSPGQGLSRNLQRQHALAEISVDCPCPDRVAHTNISNLHKLASVLLR
jgi:hypothetical protein